MHDFMNCLGFDFKILLVMCSVSLLDLSSGKACKAKCFKVTSSFPYTATSLDVTTLGDGSAMLTCSAEDVLNMQWSVSYFEMNQNIDLDTIQDSATQDFTITDGITLSSTVNSPNIESTMRVISQSGNGVQPTRVTFICSVRTQSGGDFRNENTIIAALVNPTTPSEVPDTGLPLTGSKVAVL